MLALRWLFSRTVRQAVDLRRQVRRLLHAQRDLLEPAQAQEIQAAARELAQAVAAGQGTAALRQAMDHVHEVAHQRLLPYPHPAWRELVEVLLVTGTVVLGLRTFFFQPMAIPSGSAQPTLWGVTHENLKDQPGLVLPNRLARLAIFWWSGIRYYHVVARADGILTDVGSPRLVFPFVKRQTLTVGGVHYQIWFPPLDLAARAGLIGGQSFRAGEDILKLKVTSGDHLFVNCLTYNFRRPQRGEIIVFSSHGLPDLIPDTHYIKRLVALGGDHVRIGNDRHLVVNGQRLDASTPFFEYVYSFNPHQPPHQDQYSGHVNDTVSARCGRRGIAPRFPDESTELVVRPDHYLALGDNTMNSHDGRAWGDFPREKVVGKAGFVFWPITSRFGWGYR